MLVSLTFLLQLCINGTNEMHENLQHKVKIICENLAFLNLFTFLHFLAQEEMREKNLNICKKMRKVYRTKCGRELINYDEVKLD